MTSTSVIRLPKGLFGKWLPGENMSNIENVIIQKHKVFLKTFTALNIIIYFFYCRNVHQY